MQAKPLFWCLSVTLVVTASLTVGCPAPCNLHIFDGPSAYEVKVAWDAPSTPVKEYIVYRNGFEAARLGGDIFYVGPLFDDSFLLPSHTYTYQIQAVFSNDTLSALSNPLMITALPSSPITGTNTIKSVLVRFSDFPGEPITTGYVNDLMFNDPFSVKRYYEEVSYGRYSLQGDTFGWYVLPKAGSNYCTFTNATGQWFGCDTYQIYLDALSAAPPSISNELATADITQVLVQGMGTVGESSGQTKFYSATNGFSHGPIIHEIGHGLNTLRHAGSWQYCYGYPVGPDLINLENGGCGVIRYGDYFDPMGAGGSFHYSTYFKEKLGWITQTNIQFIDHDGDYVLNATERATNSVQMLKFDLGGEQFYFFEYRTPAGFDGTNSPGVLSGATTAAIDAVVVRFRPSRSPGTDAETLEIFPKNYLESNFYFGTGAVFLDPYRNLRVEVISLTNSLATLRVSGTTNAFRINRFRQLGASKQDIEMTFNSVQDAKYLAQASTNLAEWQNVKTNILSLTNSTTIIITNGGLPDARYFRLGVDNGP